MGLKLYYDLLSQPSRTLYIFLKTCGIPFESKIVNLSKLQQFEPEYEQINPFKKVPVIDDDGFKVIESTAILKYLSRKYKVPDHWYPESLQRQAKVEEYLSWHHLNTRLHCSSYFIAKFLNPLMKGKPPNAEKVAHLENNMAECIDMIENIWLKDKLFLTGNEITIADLLATCELEQPRMAGYDPREGRPNLSAWMERVAKETHPHYQDAHKVLNGIAQKFKGKAPEKFSML